MDDVQSEYVGDAPGLDVLSDGMVPLQGGATAVADAAGSVHAPYSYDTHPHGHIAWRHGVPVTGLLVYARHDADSVIPISRSDTSANGQRSRPNPWIATRRVVYAVTPAVAR